MKFKRLSEPSGIVSSGKQAGDADDKVVREAILVHTGPEGKVMRFLSGDGPIDFDADRIANVVKVHNEKVDSLAAQYGGEDKIPTGAFEPILDMHEGTSMSDVIGRLTGRLVLEKRDVPKVGKNVICAVAKPGITFLGKEAVDRVNDGRIYHLSIGINESDNSLGETSAVIKPAAPGAMLLKQGTAGTTISKNGGFKMSDTLKRLEASKSRLTKLTEMKTMAGNFSKKLVDTNTAFKLNARKDSIHKRLSAVISGRKMTPAEYKELIKDDGLTKLASLDDATLKIALMPFEARQQPVIEVGQKGTTDGVNFGDMAQELEKKQFKRLRSEIGKDFKKMSGKKMIDDEDKDHGDKHEMGGGNELDPVNPGKDPHSVPDQAGDEEQLKAHMAHCHAALAKHLEAGDMDKAKEEHGKIMAHMKKYGMKHMSEYTGDVKSEDQQKAMNDIQMQVDELNTQMARFAGMLDEQMGAEEEEGDHLKKHLEEEIKDGKGGNPAA